jgi:hypothetical protein
MKENKGMKLLIHVGNINPNRIYSAGNSSLDNVSAIIQHDVRKIRRTIPVSALIDAIIFNLSYTGIFK